MDIEANAYIEPLIEHGPKVLGVLLALFVAWVIAGWTERGVRVGLETRNFDATLTRFFAKLIRYLILVGAFLGCLGVFGIQTASFAAVLAAAGFAVGMAFQGTLDNTKLIIPNGAVFGSTITNYSGYGVRRADVSVGAEYSADLDATRAVLEKAAANVRGMVHDPAPQVYLKGLGDSSVDWQVRIWCKPEDFWDVWEATVRACKISLDEAGIGIPFPQRDVHLDETVITALSHTSQGVP